MTPPLCPDCHAALPPGSPCCPACLAGALFSTVEDEHEGDVEPWGSIGGCDLQGELGRGGMGIVYRARQRALDRTVAVKILRDARFAGDTERARFRREALAAGRMKHPGIVSVLDVGEEDGVPWLMMEYIEGAPLDRVPRMAPREAARCMAAVAEAVEHAHAQGVLHRDLKPANILLDAAGHPRVTDFGIAQFAGGDSALTRTGQALGSPGYGAPEQILHGQADARTDVYGLGATLYHLLTGRPPFTGRTTEAVLLDLRENEPPAPRRMAPGTPRDLETICLKCLQKEPAHRYATADAVAEDLRRFLADEPIRARPPGMMGRLWRWARRHPGVAALLAVVFTLLGALAAGALVFAQGQAASERRTTLLAQAREQRAENLAGTRTAVLRDLQAAWALRPGPDVRAEAAAALGRHEMEFVRKVPALSPPPQGGSACGRYSLRRDGADWCVFSNATGGITARTGPWPEGSPAQLDDRGTRLAIAPAGRGEVLILALPGGKVLHTLPQPSGVASLAWNGELLAAGGDGDRMIHVWDTVSARRLHRLPGHDAVVRALLFRRDGQELVSAADDGAVRIWHAGAGVEVLRLEKARSHKGPAWWDATGELLHLPAADAAETDVLRITWSPVQRLLAPGADEPRAENVPGSLSLTADGTLATTVDESGVRLWSAVRGRVLAFFPRDRSEWMSAALAPDGMGLWLASWNHALRRVPLVPELPGWPEPQRAEHSRRVSGPLIVAARAGHGALAMTGAQGVSIESWPPAKPLVLPQAGAYSAALSADGRYAVTGSYSESGACLWSLPQGTLLRRLEHPGNVLGAAFAGSRLWLWGERGVTRLEVSTWEPAAPFFAGNIYAMTVNRAGTLAAGTTRHDVVVMAGDHLAEQLRLPVPAAAGRIGSATMAFSADDTTLALHCASGSVVVWKLPALREELRALGME